MLVMLMRGIKKSKFESMLVLYIMDITMLMKVDLNQKIVLNMSSELMMRHSHGLRRQPKDYDIDDDIDDDDDDDAIDE